MNSRTLSKELETINTSLLKTFLGVPSTLSATLYNSSLNYPPYNIIQSDDELKIELQMALAGWSKDDLEVEVEKDVLTVRGNNLKDDDPVEYLHKGISTKSFERTFTIGADIEVNDVKYVDGILKVFMEKIIPEEDKPRLIKIQ